MTPRAARRRGGRVPIGPRRRSRTTRSPGRRSRTAARLAARKAPRDPRPLADQRAQPTCRSTPPLPRQQEKAHIEDRAGEADRRPPGDRARPARSARPGAEARSSRRHVDIKAGGDRHAAHLSQSARPSTARPCRAVLAEAAVPRHRRREPVRRHGRGRGRGRRLIAAVAPSAGSGAVAEPASTIAADGVPAADRFERHEDPLLGDPRARSRRSSSGRSPPAAARPRSGSCSGSSSWRWAAPASTSRPGARLDGPRVIERRNAKPAMGRRFLGVPWLWAVAHSAIAFSVYLLARRRRRPRPGADAGGLRGRRR